MSGSKLKFAVIGPSGLGGSYLCIELLNRGHSVTGLSRNPESLGSHPRYTPQKLDINAVSISELASAFTGYDVIVDAYGPHSAGHEALQYSSGAARLVLLLTAARAIC
jgi:putative NADH-flavin reductase